MKLNVEIDEKTGNVIHTLVFTRLDILKADLNMFEKEYVRNCLLKETIAGRLLAMHAAVENIERNVYKV